MHDFKYFTTAIKQLHIIHKTTVITLLHTPLSRVTNHPRNIPLRLLDSAYLLCNFIKSFPVVTLSSSCNCFINIDFSVYTITVLTSFAMSLYSTVAIQQLIQAHYTGCYKHSSTCKFNVVIKSFRLHGCIGKSLVDML